jgi:(1->4)-alpha-D-glucan 1-alpha-D-glucosylmutase
LHHYFADRQSRWPFALSALSTHDTKRSEDVRARLNVLSEMPDEWTAAAARWRELNAPHRVQVEDLVVPDANEEYLLYQTLVGAWPLEPYRADEHEAFVKRVQDYMTKALHEAKIHTSWINPNADYDRAVGQFAARVLDPSLSAAFLDDFRTFQQRVSHFGLYNSLAQTLLKIAAPGAADTYQGTELWDFSLVDPDNRRPVDYERRQKMLDELRAELAGGQNAADLARSLLDAKEDGRAKLYLTWRALRCRRDHAGLFSKGDYLPLAAVGAKQQHLFGFARRNGERWALAAVPRLLTRLAPDLNTPPLGSAVWGDSKLLLADIDPTVRWQNVLTGAAIAPLLQEGQASWAAADLFSNFPVALLLGERPPA